MAEDHEELFASELRAAIERSGLSLTAISHRLRARHRPVSVATLSNWQSGRSLPGGEQSFGVVAALEELLGRSPDSLASLVGGPRLRGRGVREAQFMGRRTSREVFREALEELGFESARKYAHERVFHQYTLIDSDAEVQRFDYRLMVRALESGTCRLPAVHILEETEPNIAPIYTPLEGCSVGRSVAWPDRRANDVLLEVEFRGDRKPVACERYRRTEAGETITATRLDHRDRLQVSEARFGPGTFGLRWQWESEGGDGVPDVGPDVLAQEELDDPVGDGFDLVV